jgi:hypothetical protein
VGEPFSRLRQPSQPIPLAITALTGLTDAMVAGQSIDPAEMASHYRVQGRGRLLQGRVLVVAEAAEVRCGVTCWAPRKRSGGVGRSGRNGCGIFS